MSRAEGPRRHHKPAARLQNRLTKPTAGAAVTTVTVVVVVVAVVIVVIAVMAQPGAGGSAVWTQPARPGRGGVASKCGETAALRQRHVHGRRRRRGCTSRTTSAQTCCSCYSNAMAAKAGRQTLKTSHQWHTLRRTDPTSPRTYYCPAGVSLSLHATSKARRR